MQYKAELEAMTIRPSMLDRRPQCPCIISSTLFMRIRVGLCCESESESESESGDDGGRTDIAQLVLRLCASAPVLKVLDLDLDRRRLSSSSSTARLSVGTPSSISTAEPEHSPPPPQSSTPRRRACQWIPGADSSLRGIQDPHGARRLATGDWDWDWDCGQGGGHLVYLLPRRESAPQNNFTATATAKATATRTLCANLRLHGCRVYS